MTPDAHQPADDGVTRWLDRPVTEVIAYIVRHYHVPLRRQLAEITRLAPSAGLGQDVAEKLAVFVEELSQHLIKEERVAFPMIRTAGGYVGVAFGVMEHEHDLMDALLVELREVLPTVPAREADPSPRARIAALLEIIEIDMRPHAALEEALFAHFRTTG